MWAMICLIYFLSGNGGEEAVLIDFDRWQPVSKTARVFTGQYQRSIMYEGLLLNEDWKVDKVDWYQLGILQIYCFVDKVSCHEMNISKHDRDIHFVQELLEG